MLVDHLVKLIFYIPVFFCTVAYFLDFAKVKKSAIVIPYFTSFGMFLLTLLSYFFVYKANIENFEALEVIFTWVTFENHDTNFVIDLSKLSIFMLFLVCNVSFLVHIYSISYMKHCTNYSRFMINISFFTFCMIVLICSNNLLQLFFGWEGVGFASYLLINYYHQKSDANLAAMKAFLVNRFADIFMISAIVLIYNSYKTFNIDAISIIHTTNSRNLDIICILFVLAAMGKSAQFLLHVWLPSAMTGPTPVSALMHAATMVTAGIFLICKCSAIFDASSEYVKHSIITIGTLTAFCASVCAIMQNDIKKVIAYSTCSQLGYMMTATGFGFYSGAFFHILTHGFFKALLFLCAGAVIMATQNQDLCKMPAKLYKKLPVTFATMTIGSFAICGMPYFAGYYSKDAIIFASEILAKNSQFHLFASIVLNFCAFLTAIYSFRLIFLVFFSNNEEKEVEKVGINVNSILISLSIFAIFSGYILQEFLGIFSTDFFDSIGNRKIITRLKEYESYFALLLSLFGMFLTVLSYFLRNKFGIFFSKVKNFLDFINSKSYINDFYEVFCVKLYKILSNFIINKIDFPLINKILVEKPSNILLNCSNSLKKVNCGKINAYVSIILVFLILILCFFEIIYKV